MSFKLRPYQEECLEAIFNSKKQYNLVMSSVGSGKTIIFSTLAAKSTGRVLILTPSTELRIQAEEKLKEIDPELHVGSVQADLDDVDAKIVCATRQSLINPKSTRLRRMLEHGDFEYLIVDECHQAPKSIKKIINRLNKDIKIIGFSATPYTKECIDIFGQPIFKRNMIDMIEQEFLIEPRAIVVESKTNISNVRVQNGEFVASELENAVNNTERNLLILESYKKYGKDRKSTLIFAVGIEHAQTLHRIFLDEGINAGYIDGNTPRETRDEIIEKFKKLEIPVCINVLALTTGFDAVAVDTLILARPVKSRILFEQILGRGLRLSPKTNKTDCLVIDIMDISKNHDLMDLSSAFNFRIKDKETPSEAKKRIKKEQEEEEERLRREEERRREEEILKQQEMELRIQRVKLFNKDMANRFKETTYDWFKVDTQTYAITFESDKHYVVEQYEDDSGKLNNYCYEICTKKDDKYAINITEHDNLKSLLEYVEHSLVQKKSSFVLKDAEWKKQAPTENQLKYLPWATTKFQCHIYFTSNSIKGILKKFRSELINNG